MKQYKIRPGIVKAEICGVSLLVPKREAFEACQSVLRLNMMTSFTWSILEKNDPKEGPEKVRKMISLLAKTSEEEAEPRAEKVLQSLCERGFLIELPEE